jgi:hypothetical protein
MSKTGPTVDFGDPVFLFSLTLFLIALAIWFSGMPDLATPVPTPMPF